MATEPVASWADDAALFTEALIRELFVPWGVECLDCGEAFYGEAFTKPCVACKNSNLVPLYAGRRRDVAASE